jgi:hypothetical protein
MEPWCSDCTGSNRRCLKPSSSTSRFPTIDLPRASRKIGTHPTIRGVGRVPLDEGKGGGTGGALPPLPSGTRGRPTVVHDTAARQGAVTAATEVGDEWGWAWAGMLFCAGPEWKNSKER